ncbi:MAG: hypothetical protein H6592_15350 [Flavobacteriales bacterium]|nr:hypothetical protein [Flavobacteriales bacterium]
MKRLLLLPLLLLGLTQVQGQYGYLGAKNIVSVGLTEPIWSDAWSLSYYRVLSRVSGLRLDVRLLNVDRELRSGGHGWLGLYDGDKLGTVTGSGFGLGLHYAFNAGGGLSQPQGYFMSLGLEYTTGTTEEKLDRNALSPYWFPYGFVPTLDYEYTHTTLRLVYVWGIRKVLADRFTAELGMEFGWIFKHTIETEDDLKGAMYALGFERNVFVHADTGHDRFGGFQERSSDMGMSVTLTPMARIGVLF